MHVEKYRKDAAGHILRHYNRTAKNYSNKEIDKSRTVLNYNLAPDREQTDVDYYKNRLKEVKCLKRKDVNTLCDWIVTLPKGEFSDDEDKEFFRTAYEFMQKRYGEKNVISAWVHRDEGGQPHMHFCFIPVLDAKGIEKVCAKEVINKTELQKIHYEIDEVMKQRFGRDIGLVNSATSGGNKTVLELKKQKLRADVQALEKVRTAEINQIADMIRKKPSILAEISRAVRIAMGKELPVKNIEMAHERSR